MASANNKKQKEDGSEEISIINLSKRMEEMNLKNAVNKEKKRGKEEPVLM